MSDVRTEKKPIKVLLLDDRQDNLILLVRHPAQQRL